MNLNKLIAHGKSVLREGYADNTTIWNFIIDNGIATEDELQLATSLTGYTEETLNNVIYIRTGYRDMESYSSSELTEECKKRKSRKRRIKEGVGSEGLCYIMEADNLHATETSEYTVTVDGGKGRVCFNYPHDYGFAIQVLSDEFNNIRLHLVY